MAEERLQKVLARAGIASRRASEALITEGRVSVDGRIVRELGVRVNARASRIEVDGKRLVAEPLVYIVLHKPRGVMCTLSDPEGRPTVAELLRDVGVRVVPIGRLDFHTSGALLCTNDGDFAGKLLHPRGKVPKEYVAKVRGVVDERALERWRESILIDGRATQPADVHLMRVEGDKSWLSIVLKEGRNRQVRRLGEATGFEVLRLVRVAHAGITAEKVLPGQWRHLTREELKALKQTYGVPHRIHTPPELDHMGGRLVRSSSAKARSQAAAPGARGFRDNEDVPRPGRHEESGYRAASAPRDTKPSRFTSGTWGAEEGSRGRTERRPSGPARGESAGRGPSRRASGATGGRASGSPRREDAHARGRFSRQEGAGEGSRHAGPPRASRPERPTRTRRTR
ncbi:MAG TPA: pseudouridine synthase [Polyangiaceae bacterium]|nr:pseudouridine synthase [Polyangiaceae bacterium]